MNNKFIMLLVFLMSVTACSYIKKPPYNDPSDDATIWLAEAAHSVSNSMLDMAKTEKVLTPPHRDNMMTIPNTPNLQKHASIEWSGPIAEVTKRVAKAANYHFRIIGQEPAIPILVGVSSKHKTLGEILRNIDYQAGNKAYIRVYPRQQVIELRYANLYT